MATTWKAPTWRMPNDKNQSKFESYSIDFNGMDPLNCGNSDTLNIASSNYSISTWIKYTTSANQVVCEKGSNNQLALQIGGGSNQGKISWIGGADYAITSANAINDGNWHHVCCVAYGSSSIFYIDGQVSATGGSKTQVANTSNFMIGGRGTSYGFTGSMSQLCLFDYDLSSAQVSSLYNSGSPINPMTLKPAPIASYLLGGDASTGGNATLSVPNVAVPDASVFDFVPNDKIDATIPALNNAVALTFSGWFKKTSGNVIGFESFVSGTDRAILYWWSDNNVYWSVRNGSSSTATSSALSNFDWNHIAGTFDGSTNTIKLYINGSLVDTETGQPSSTSANLASNFHIGLSNGSTYNTGQISNAQIWNTALLALEIETLYNSGVPLLTGTQPQAANLKAWYKLDQSANWEADTAGNWQIPDAVSAYPQSFDFDGSSGQEIAIGNNTLINGFASATFSFWFKGKSGLASFDGLLCQRSLGSDYCLIHVDGVSGSNYKILMQQSGGGYARQDSATLQLNKWYHVCVTGSVGSIWNIYINGQLSNSYGSAQNISGIVQNNAPFRIGRDGTTSVAVGEFSNVQIFNTELPATGTNSVETLYNNGAPLTTAIATNNLKAWYKLNDSLDLFSGNLPDVMFLPNDYKQNFTKALRIADTAGKSINLASSLDLGTEHTISYWLISPASWGTRSGSIATDGSHNRIYISNSTAYYRASSGTQVYDSNMGWGWYGQAGVWYNFVITRKDGNVNFYNNGSITSSSPHSFTASETLSLKDFLGHSSQWGESIISNIVILDKELTSSEVTTMYNNGNPIYNLSDIPQSNNVKLWWKLNTDPSSNIVDSSGNNQTGVTSNYVSSDLKNIAVGTNSGKTSGMTEQNLVNNNVSVLNGESSGMDTSNLVTSTLTRKVPYNSYSLNFDGNDDYIDCGGDASLQMTGDISVSAWFKTSSTGVQKQIIGRGADWVMNGWSLFVAGDNKVKIMLNAGGYPVAASNTTVTDGEWHHVLGVRDSSGGAGSLKLYLDGVEGVSVDGGSTAMANGSETWIASGTNFGSKMNGKISNVAVWNKALTPTEALKLYNSGVPSDLSSFNPSPISWWSLGSDSYYNGNNWICPDLVSTNNGISNGMGANALVGNAPNSTANGTSTNMTIDANLTGNAPNSSNNSFSVNMSFDDRETDAPS